MVGALNDDLPMGSRVGGRRSGLRSLLGWITFLLFAGLVPAGAQTKAPPAKAPLAPLRTITMAYTVHSLSSKEAARAYPVHLRAVVTFWDPGIGLHNASLYVHDASGSVFVRVPFGVIDSLPVGSLIDLRGVSDPGEFGPIVTRSTIKVIGYSGLPPNPDRPSFVRLLAGLEDGQWVEVEGVVHSILEIDRHISMQLTMSDGTISALIERVPGVTYSNLVDARVRIRGNAGPLFDSSRTQMIGFRIQCPNLSAIKVLEPPPEDPFKLPIIPIDRLLRWDLAPLLAHRVHVRGRVTLQWPGSSVCIWSATKGICAQTDQSTRLRNGELIDIAGFARAEGSVPVLMNAVYRSAGSAAAELVSAVPVTPDQVLQGGHESQFIQIDGQLISRDLASADTTLLLSSGKYIYKAILPQALGGAETGTWKNGSVLRLTGISSVQLDTQRSVLGMGTAIPTSFRVLMRSPADVVVLQKPSWWTPVHAVLMLTFALTATLLVLGWVVVLRRQIGRAHV